MLSRFVVSQVKHNSYFLVGLALGLWLALAGVPLGEEAACGAAPASAASAPDEYEPVREERPLGPAGAPARALQRPRYYTTELGMRAPLLAAALTDEDVLDTRAAALNRTAARLQPALRFFITARGPAAPGLPNVVGFTDTREMLKPFHALKYLADNYLEEYDFFFLVSDATFVNARRLSELVGKLSVSQDIYMGSIADDDSHYCSLEGGILLSNSVLRAVHGELDWCVRNSYSPRHHENLGRCVLHAAHTACTASAQGEQYVSLGVSGTDGVSWGAALRPALAGAVTAHALHDPKDFYTLHAYVARVYLERDGRRARRLAAHTQRALRHLPAGFRNATWPAGLRTDPGLAPPTPDNRFDHLRWTRFNATHALMPDDHHAVAPLTTNNKLAVQLVTETALAWAERRWGRPVELVQGAWRWEPAQALRYKLLLRLAPAEGGRQHSVRQVEVVRGLGAARLVPLPYVTESARVWALVPASGASGASEARELLHRVEAVCLKRAANIALIVIIVQREEDDEDTRHEQGLLRDATRALADKYRAANVQLVEHAEGGEGSVGLEAGLRAAPRDALVLLLAPHVEFNDDFLNRVRMNTISGVQWYLPVGFARYSQYEHPLFVDAAGHRPQVNTGRFNLHHTDVLSFYRTDYDEAVSSWTGEGEARSVPVARLLAAAPLRCVRAPDPALVRAPRGAPALCAPAPSAPAQCPLEALDLGARHALARLLLETQAAADGA